MRLLFICHDALFMSHEQCTKHWHKKKKLKRVCKPKPLYSPLTIILQVNWVLVILLKTENNNKNN